MPATGSSIPSALSALTMKVWVDSRGVLRGCERIVVVASSRHVVATSPVAARSHHYRTIGCSLREPDVLIAEKLWGS